MNNLFLGIMSGTSLDGIDVAIARFEHRTAELVAFYSIPFREELRARLLETATAKMVEMDTLVRTHFMLAKEYAGAVQSALSATHLRASDIRAIGLHGQTVRHLPEPPNPATLQLGSGAALAAHTGIDVVSDFRSADIALGGQGAPLMPMFDFFFLRSETTDRLIVNVGGIANVTWLRRNAREEDVVAFDTGPGNMLLDAATRRWYQRDFDEDGACARRGKIHEALLDELLSNSYFNAPPPKSTGRELFSEGMLAPVYALVTAGDLRPEDALATLTEVTARSIAQSVRFVLTDSEHLEAIVSGGGAFNRFLLERISQNLGAGSRVVTSAAYGIPPKAKEAMAFAFFAKAFVEEMPIHLPLTTGARCRAMLGSLSRGSR
ncbi:MAG: anhydro-N-acetylmuramic acid kinase [Acidobacteriaceae bacterium]